MSIPELAPKSNPYARRPFCITIYSALERRPVRSLYLLGTTPKVVWDAANRSKLAARLLNPKDPNRWPATEWSAADQKILSKYYGSDWRSALTPDVKFVQEAAVTAVRVGAAEPAADDQLDFGDLRTLNNLDEDGAVIIQSEDLQPRRGSEPSQRATRRSDREIRRDSVSNKFAPTASPGTLFSKLGVFPEDSFRDLGDKIFAATGIPPFRQHVFWESDLQTNPQSQQSYLVTDGGTEYPVDIRTLGAQEGVRVSNVPIDQYLSTQADRGEIFVEGLDSFRLVGEAMHGSPLFHVFVADLEELITPNRQELQGSTQDQLQMDLLYSGFILKYWPKLNQNATLLYLTSRDSEALDELYPLLTPEQAAVSAQYEKQQAIIHNSYLRQDNVYRRFAQPRSLAVTSATISVDASTFQHRRSQMRLNVRNIFDRFAATTTWPLVMSRFFLQSSVRGGRQDVTAIKKHVSAALGGNDDSIEINRMAGRTLRRSSMMIAVRTDVKKNSADCGLIGGEWQKGRGKLVAFTLFDDGSYSLESSWSEDLRYTPNDVVHELKRIIHPLIEKINGMGALAFPTGGELAAPQADGSMKNVQIRDMTVSAIWQRVLTDPAFRILKTRWREYEAAKIVAIRGLQQAGAFAFQMHKGVIDYDSSAIERTIIVSTTTDCSGRVQTVREITERTQNTYSYLTDSIIAQRWGCVYPGRTVRFFHRTADVRVEMVGISGSELEKNWRWIFSFFDGLEYGADKIPGILPPGSSSGRSTRRGLKDLQDKDPELYDLRKFDRSAVVYSVLCQNPRPPILHSSDEAAALPEKRKKKLVEYWNYTENKPAFYECATDKFPHLSFLEGRHPKGYCLPCCQKTVAFPGSRREQINQQCLAAVGKDGDGDRDFELGEASSRHILAYGKRISPGRVASLGTFFESQLFYQTLPDSWVYRLEGVAQYLPAIPSAGFYFAIAMALSKEPQELGADFAFAVAHMGDTYGTLVEGRVGELFPDQIKFVEAITQTFATGDISDGRSGGKFTPFSPGGVAHEIWEDLVEELAAICYEVYFVVIEDVDGSMAQTYCKAQPRTVEKMRNNSETDEFGVIFRIGQPEGKRAAGGIYPLSIHGPSAAPGSPRQILSLFMENGVTEGFTVTLKELVLYENQSKSQGKWGMDSLAKFLQRSQGKEYTPLIKLIGKRDLCYGAVLERNGAQFYVPIRESHHSINDTLSGLNPDIQTHYGTRKTLQTSETAGNGKYATVLAFLGALKINKGTPNMLRSLLVDARGKYVGADIVFSPQESYNFYFEPVDESAASELKTLYAAKDAQIVLLPIDPALLDEAIFTTGAVRDPGSAIGTRLSAQREAYQLILYRLFLSEFASAIYRQKDAETRELLLAAMQKSSRESGKKIASIIAETGLAPDAVERDIVRLNDLVLSLRGAKADKLRIMLDQLTFEFDIKELHQIRGAPREKANASIRKIMETRVQLLSLEEIEKQGLLAGILRSGLFSSCLDPNSQDLAAPCVGSKLAVDSSRFDALLDLLTTEVQNPLKWDSFIFKTAGILDDLDFVRRPCERLELKF